MDKHQLPIILDSTLPSSDIRVPVKSGKEAKKRRRGVRAFAVIIFLVAGVACAFLGMKSIPFLHALASPAFSCLMQYSFPSRPTPTPPVTTDEVTSENESESETAIESESESEMTSEPDSDTNVTEETTGEATEQEFFSSDMSLWELGATHIDNSTILVPNVRDLLQTESPRVRAILIVTSHPSEMYADGGSVKEIAAELEKSLSANGIQALYALPPDSADTSAVIDYYLNLYPEIDLVLDLRRSAELSDGKLLRPIYTSDTKEHAQVRIICDSRGEGLHMTEKNLSLALKLREQMFCLHPSASRPVWLREGTNSYPGNAFYLTVELGAAGNTISEAERAVYTFSHALSALVSRA